MLLPPNMVLYLDAFDGVKADLRYTYTRSGLEQDVILREAVEPEDYGMDPATTVLEVWTEFVEAPSPHKSPRILKEDEQPEQMVSPDILDEVLDFGAMKMGAGVAFSLVDAEGELNERRSRSVPVGKQWFEMKEKGTYLVESVDYMEIEGDLAALPKAQARAKHKPMRGRAAMVASIGRGRPGPGKAKPPGAEVKPVRIAVLDKMPAQAGLVIDYTTSSGSLSNFTFRGDETYYISGPLTLSGTTTFEGGTVLKFDSDGYLAISGTAEFKADMYRPVYFTAKQDSTVGQRVTSGMPSSGWFDVFHPGYSMTALTLSHVRVRYADRCVYPDSLDFELTVRHGQIVESNILLESYYDATLTKECVGK